MADEVRPTINYPVWTEYRKKNGLDPLGMQNSSVSLYQTFLPGISNVTLRMRYYGLYAWLCRAYAQKIGDTNPESWKRCIRRAEALYALIAYRHGREGGVAGIEWAQKILDSNLSGSIEFAQAAEPGSENYYLKQAWGAYGAAYRSQLFEIGIFDPSNDHEVPLPSKEIGERLATVFEASVGELASLFYDIVQRGSVTDDELHELRPLAPSEIALSGEERDLYQEILLGASDATDGRAGARRDSILLILKIAVLLGRAPNPEEVRWILFAGCDQKGRALDLGSPALKAQRQLWWIYHANDLCHVAYETLLKFTLDTLADYPAGIALSRLIPLCVEKILMTVPVRPTHWTAFVDASMPASNSYAADDDGSEFSISTAIMRRAGRNDASVCAPEIAWNAVRLLAILHRRVRDEDRDIATVLGRFNPEAFHSLLTEARFLEAHRGETFEALLARLLEERIVQRHLWVALQKLRAGDYTFLIERDEGKLRLRGKDGPVFTNPRLGPAITFLKDIHLIGDQGLTEYGAAAAGVA
ncbi:hypothetical protein EDC65_5324 [Stella humosa]|uniref:Uncharacterized protein n=1 Tax=Stella humosa TaxID=94 RepID=A0A3N1KQC6_9PROT|nr:hypothetical protein [Stella humosa]ROP80989.1 hypothetical protein EDC65_5324 [Stella humosa]BBK29677.1 hypothetical protein STHU_03110 [Stella humosa]